MKSALTVTGRNRLVGLLLIALLGLLVQVDVSAQQSGLAFLGIGPDAAGMALGDAGVASATGAFATERNPALLASGSSAALGITHHQWLGDITTYGISGRFNAGQNGGVGLFVRATGSGDLEARDRPGPAAGTFDVQFIAAGAGLARSIGPVSLGATAKYLSERILSVSATGYAFDLGAQVRLAGGAVSLGAALQNLGSMDELADRSTTLPRTARAGIAVQPFRVLAFEDGSTLLDAVISAELSRNTVDGRTNLHFGAESAVLEMVRLRVGYISNDALRDFSAGLGLDAGGFRVDYAMLPFESGFDGPGHVVTLVYGVGR